MLVHIPAVLTKEELVQCQSAFAASGWVDGKITAGVQSGEAKHNLQLQEGSAEARQLGEIILRALGRNPGLSKPRQTDSDDDDDRLNAVATRFLRGSASFSPDGVTWTEVAREILPIGTGPVLAGMALTSHSDAEVASETIENVSITPGNLPASRRPALAGTRGTLRPSEQRFYAIDNWRYAAWSADGGGLG